MFNIVSGRFINTANFWANVRPSLLVPTLLLRKVRLRRRTRHSKHVHPTARLPGLVDAAHHGQRHATTTLVPELPAGGHMIL